MKKTILAGASVIALTATAPLFAQATVPAECATATGNCSVVDSAGTGNTATVDQAGGSISEVIQDGTSLNADVAQDGAGNLSNIDQENIVPGAGATATIAQTGAGNSSDITQLENGSIVGDPQALVTQTGDNNSSIVDQSGLNGGTLITATVDQTLNDSSSSVIHWVKTGWF